MATLKTQFQDPSESIRYEVDFIDDLADGDTLVAATWEAAGLTVSGASFTGTKTSAMVSGVALGELYTVEVTVVTQNGETKNAGFYVRGIAR